MVLPRRSPTAASHVALTGSSVARAARRRSAAPQRPVGHGPAPLQDPRGRCWPAGGPGGVDDSGRARCARGLGCCIAAHAVDRRVRLAVAADGLTPLLGLRLRGVQVRGADRPGVLVRGARRGVATLRLARPRVAVPGARAQRLRGARSGSPRRGRAPRRVRRAARAPVSTPGRSRRGRRARRLRPPANCAPGSADAAAAGLGRAGAIGAPTRVRPARPRAYEKPSLAAEVSATGRDRAGCCAAVVAAAPAVPTLPWTGPGRCREAAGHGAGCLVTSVPAGGSPPGRRGADAGSTVSFLSAPSASNSYARASFPAPCTCHAK